MMAIHVYILLFFLSLLQIKCQNIVGCGGFVKSDIKEFKFQRLAAHLVFPDGTVNYITDILPNGAYSIPIYDFGEYVLKIIGPKGWNIEPSDGFHIVVNGQDSCSHDYNFMFTGFSVYGKVSTANINQGPSGIRIDLMKDENILSFATTIEGGEFIMNNVLPGKYFLNVKSKTVEGKVIELNDDNYDIEVTNDNIVIADSFIIHGYPVFGDVRFQNKPVMGVEFYVFSKSINAVDFDFSKYKCIKFDQNDLKLDGYNALCKTLSNAEGVFLFPLLPGGQYIVLPVYKINNSKFDIEPSRYEFQVTSHSVDLRSFFTISGFSVKGRIVAPESDIGVYNAQIFVDDKYATKTDSNGDFIITRVNEGSHKLSIIADGYLFNKTAVQFDSGNTFIGIFHPFKISICGTIVIDTKYVSRNAIDELSLPREIIMIDETTGNVLESVHTSTSVVNDNDVESKKLNNVISQFCFYAVPGKYIIKPVSDSAVKLSLAPNQIKVQLKSKPMTVKFSQFRGTISGSVRCIERCNTGEFEVTLKSTDDNNESPHLIQHFLISESLPNEGAFTFKDIIPGNYEVELISANGHFASYKNRWCWSHTILSVMMIDEDIKSGLIFEQTGFSLQFHLSHTMFIDYFHLLNDQRELIESNKLVKGFDRICLPKSGKYEINMKTCHKLVNDSIIFDTNVATDSQIKLDVIQYKVHIDFVLTNVEKDIDQKELESDINGLITYNLNSDPILKPIEWQGNVGHLEFWVEPETSIQVSAKSNKFLVKPEKINFQLARETLDCVTNIGKFELELGTFIVGSVSPPIKEAVIEVHRLSPSFEEDIVESVITSGETDENGEFNLGPLSSSFKYDIRLSKSGYKFIKAESSDNVYRYKSLKLAELHVAIVDSVSGQPVTGILLSIISDTLRKNELTDEAGKFTFVGLTEGTYYLRAMMKELEFSPSGAIEIKMDEGGVQHVSINASRTSFSIYGKVVSLNGEPETGISIEADPVRDSDTSCQLSLMRNEHAFSDESGSFRIRGLLPKCRYRLSLKISDKNDEQGVVRSHPRHIDVTMASEDVHSVKLYALRSINLREIAAMVWTNDDVYLNSLQISVFPSGNPDNVLSTHKVVSDSVFFQMTLPQSSKRVEYVIRLQSSLSPRLYSNMSAQEVLFVVEPGSRTFFKYFQFDFYPTKNVIGDPESSLTISSSILFPLFLFVISLVFYKKDSLQPLFVQAATVVGRLVNQIFSYRNNYTSTNTPVGSLDAAEISELNNVIAKPKASIIPISIKKPPFWLRPKKV